MVDFGLFRVPGLSQCARMVRQEEYVALAVSLVTDFERIRRLRRRLEHGRASNRFRPKSNAIDHMPGTECTEKVVIRT